MNGRLFAEYVAKPFRGRTTKTYMKNSTRGRSYSLAKAILKLAERGAVGGGLVELRR